MRLTARLGFCELLIVAPLLFFSCFSQSFAQTEPGSEPENDLSISADGARIVYPASYFDQFNPVTLEDMLRRIPGASIDDSSSGQERRGLRGNEDAILINGQQVISKDGGGSSVLRRITAVEVDRIEIIRGTSNEVQSTTQRIINVTLLADKGATTTLVSSFLHYAGGNANRLGQSLTYSVNQPDRNYTLFFRNRDIHRPWQRPKQTTDLAGLEILSSDETEGRDRRAIDFSGRYEQLFDSGSRLQLNALVELELIDRAREETLINPQLAAPENLVSDRLELDERDELIAELSVDYSFPLANGNAITLLGLFNWEREERDRDVLDLAAPMQPVVTRQARQDTSTESIVRVVYDHRLSDSLGAQFGLEGTLNTQETDFDLATLVNGELIPLPIFNSSGEVEEDRAEAFTTLQWQVSEKVSSELGLAYEKSRISQSGIDVDNSRQLTFFKPTLNLFWTINPQNKLILSVARDVQQLNFSDFVASIAEQDEELEAGNPDLLPETSWDTELTYEHNFKEGAGLVSLAGFHRQVSDISGRVGFRGLISQPGNLGSGNEYGIRSELSLQFTNLGWWNGALSANYLRRTSSVTDPFDGRRRNFADTPDWEFSLNYRHDLNNIINGYFDISYSRDGEEFTYDLDYIESDQEDGSLTLTLSHQFRKNSQINFAIFNALNRGITLDREIFQQLPDGGRTAISRRVEKHHWGRLFNIQFRFTF